MNTAQKKEIAAIQIDGTGILDDPDGQQILLTKFHNGRQVGLKGVETALMVVGASPARLVHLDGLPVTVNLSPILDAVKINLHHASCPIGRHVEFKSIQA